jgi:hypothetical protein
MSKVVWIRNLASISRNEMQPQFFDTKCRLNFAEFYEHFIKFHEHFEKFREIAHPPLIESDICMTKPEKFETV